VPTVLAAIRHRRISFDVRTLAVILILLSATLAEAAPRRILSAGERQSLHQRYESWMGRWEWWNRGAYLQGINYGARGRINATNDAAQKAETPYLPGITDRWF
jgi:hypothetical protein